MPVERAELAFVRFQQQQRQVAGEDTVRSCAGEQGERRGAHLTMQFITIILAKGGGQVHGDSLWRGGVMLGRILARCKIHYL
ncbi:hypothetical protein PsSCT_12940 [Pseudomonas sp. SCT]